VPDVTFAPETSATTGASALDATASALTTSAPSSGWHARSTDHVQVGDGEHIVELGGATPDASSRSRCASLRRAVEWESSTTC
jgi:hypothetical protein